MFMSIFAWWFVTHIWLMSFCGKYAGQPTRKHTQTQAAVCVCVLPPMPRVASWCFPSQSHRPISAPLLCPLCLMLWATEACSVSPGTSLTVFHPHSVSHQQPVFVRTPASEVKIRWSPHVCFYRNCMTDLFLSSHSDDNWKECAHYPQKYVVLHLNPVRWDSLLFYAGVWGDEVTLWSSRIGWTVFIKVGMNWWVRSSGCNSKHHNTYLMSRLVSLNI